MNDVLVQAHKIRKSYLMGEVTVEALQGIDLKLDRGEFLAIMGPSGSGKSTLLHILAGLERPSTGSVEYGELALHSMHDRELTLLRRRKIGIVFQFFNLLPNLSAIENVALPLLLDGQSLASSRKKAAEALALVGLEGRDEHTPDRLSGGEQQRTALARALVHQPDLLLADEPTGNLDRGAGKRLLALLRRICDEKNQTIVMVTHDPFAASFADRVVFLADGSVVDELRGERMTPEAIINAHSLWKNSS